MKKIIVKGLGNNGDQYRCLKIRETEKSIIFDGVMDTTGTWTPDQIFHHKITYNYKSLAEVRSNIIDEWQNNGYEN